MTKQVRTLQREFPFAKVEPTRGGHLCLYLPNGRKVFTSATPSDWRTLQNIHRDVRRQLALTAD